MTERTELNFETVKSWIEKSEIHAEINLVSDVGKAAIKAGLKTTRNYNFVILAAQILQLAVEEEIKSPEKT